MTGTEKLTEVLDRETGQGKVVLFHGRIEQIIDQAAKNAALAKTQYKFRKKAGRIDTRVFARGRSKSKRVKESSGRRKDTTDKIGQNATPDNVEQRKQGARKKSEGGKTTGNMAENPKGGGVPRRPDVETTERTRYKGTGHEKNTRRTG